MTTDIAEKEPYTPPANGFRTFVIVWVTQALSVFGSALTFFAVTIWLTQTLYPLPEQKADLAFALAAQGLAFGLPTMIIAPIAGAWADRHDRKRIMISMDLANGVLSFLIMLLMASGLLQLWMLLILMALFAISTSFHGSAFDTSTAMLVPEKQLPRANGMMQTIWSLSGILSPAIAAGLIALPALARKGSVPGDLGIWLGGLKDGAPVAIAIDSATFFLAAIVLSFLFIPSPKRTDLVAQPGQKRKSIWSDVQEGALYIWRRRPLLWLLGTFTLTNFVMSPLQVFLPLLLRFNLQPDWSTRGFEFETALALLGTAGGLGGLLGGIFISTWGGLKKRRVYGVVVPIMFAGIGQIVFGLSPWIYLTAAMVFLLDAMIPIMNSHSQAIWQIQTPHELQGRVFSVRRVIAQFSWPLATMMAGVLGGLFNPGYVMAVLGLILVVFCIFQLFNPYLLRVEDKAWLEELAASRGDTNAQRVAEPADVEPAGVTAAPSES